MVARVRKCNLYMLELIMVTTASGIRLELRLQLDPTSSDDTMVFAEDLPSWRPDSSTSTKPGPLFQYAYQESAVLKPVLTELGSSEWASRFIVQRRDDDLDLLQRFGTLHDLCRGCQWSEDVDLPAAPHGSLPCVAFQVVLEVSSIIAGDLVESHPLPTTQPGLGEELLASQGVCVCLRHARFQLNNISVASTMNQPPQRGTQPDLPIGQAAPPLAEDPMHNAAAVPPAALPPSSDTGPDMSPESLQRRHSSSAELWTQVQGRGFGTLYKAIWSVRVLHEVALKDNIPFHALSPLPPASVSKFLAIARWMGLLVSALKHNRTLYNTTLKVHDQLTLRGHDGALDTQAALMLQHCSTLLHRELFLSPVAGGSVASSSVKAFKTLAKQYLVGFPRSAAVRIL
jgi:hypothetical protein